MVEAGTELGVTGVVPTTKLVVHAFSQQACVIAGMCMDTYQICDEGNCDCCFIHQGCSAEYGLYPVWQDGRWICSDNA